MGDCAGLAWSEVVETICEHLAWVTPTGCNKFASCAKALTKLERAGLLRLPVKQVGLGGRQRVVFGALSLRGVRRTPGGGGAWGGPLPLPRRRLKHEELLTQMTSAQPGGMGVDARRVDPAQMS